MALEAFSLPFNLLQGTIEGEWGVGSQKGYPWTIGDKIQNSAILYIGFWPVFPF
jgi:hypothetical protein